MRSRLIVLFLLALGAFNSASAQIDFTPTAREYTAGGFTHRELIFKSDKGTVTFAPPAKWNVSGEKDRLRMSPPDKNFVEVSIQSLVSSVPLNFDDAGLAALEQQALRDVPPAAQSSQISSRAANTIVMGSNQSFEFVISYHTLGQHFQKSVIFVNGPTPLLVRFTAPKADYARFDGEFRQSLFTWQRIESLSPMGAGALAASN
jgi:hypothetical protein